MASCATWQRAAVRRDHDFDAYAFGLLQRLDPALASVSAVVPNYNYEPYIGARLRSVFDQSHPLREVVVLDDASPDGSLAEIARVADDAGRRIALHANTTNTGSPFRQWRKGVELAKGDHVWIAEADDLAEPGFVAQLIAQMQVAGSVLGFTDSRQIDEHGEPLGDSYRSYINQIAPGAFDEPFDMDGPEFLARFLAIKNVILNVSGVLVHRQTLLDAFDAVGDGLYSYGVAGDWRLYAQICTRAGNRVSWLPGALNTHRRHRVSVTHALKVDKHLSEIANIGSDCRAARREGASLDGANTAVSGAPRVGKSILSKRMSETGRWLVVPLDTCRRAFRSLENDFDRALARNIFLTQIARKFNTGIVIDGDDLLSANRSSSAGLEPMSCCYLTLVQDVLRMRVAVLGNSVSTIDEKLEGMRTWHAIGEDRAVARGEESAIAVARASLSISRDIRKLCSATGIKYYEIAAIGFDDTMDRLVELMMEDEDFQTHAP